MMVEFVNEERVSVFALDLFLFLFSLSSSVCLIHITSSLSHFRLLEDDGKGQEILRREKYIIYNALERKWEEKGEGKGGE